VKHYTSSLKIRHKASRVQISSRDARRKARVVSCPLVNMDAALSKRQCVALTAYIAVQRAPHVTPNTNDAIRMVYSFLGLRKVDLLQWPQLPPCWCALTRSAPAQLMPSAVLFHRDLAAVLFAREFAVVMASTAVPRVTPATYHGPLVLRKIHL